MVSSSSCVVVAFVVVVVVEVVEEEVVLLTLVVGARPVVSRCPPGHRIGTHPAMCTFFIHTWPDIHSDNLACLCVYKCILKEREKKKYFKLTTIVVLCPRSWLWGGGSNAWTDGGAGSSSTAD